MQIQSLEISKIKPYEKNAKKHPESQLEALAKVISEVGWRQNIIVNSAGVIIAGHGRFAAWQKFKDKYPMAEPWVMNDKGETISGAPETKPMTPEQEKMWRLADNKLNESEWDMGLVVEELKLMDDYMIDLSGFELDLTIIKEENDDDVPAVNENVKSKLGDVYSLGEHLLICGDSTDYEVVDQILPEKASMCFTDPPYLMNFEGGVHADGPKSFNAKHGKIKNDKMSEKDGDEFLDKINNVIKNKTVGAFYITFYRLGIDKYYRSLSRVGLDCRALIIWAKGNHTLSNSDYKSMYEPMFYGWVETHNFYGGKNGMDIWEIKRTQKNDLHPTMKPVELVEKAILDGSERDDTVLDLFGGSGTTLIACEKTRRKARIVELEPKYIDVIIQRWEDYTKQKAKLINNIYEEQTPGT